MDEKTLEEIYTFKKGKPTAKTYRNGRGIILIAHFVFTLWAIVYFLIYARDGDYISGLLACIMWGGFTNIMVYGTSLKGDILAPMLYDEESRTITTSRMDIFLDSILFIEVIRYKNLNPRNNMFVAVGYQRKNNSPGISISKGTESFKAMKFNNFIRQLREWPRQDYPKIVKGFWFSGHYKWKRERMNFLKEISQGTGLHQSSNV